MWIPLDTEPQSLTASVGQMPSKWRVVLPLPPDPKPPSSTLRAALGCQRTRRSQVKIAVSRIYKTETRGKQKCRRAGGEVPVSRVGLGGGAHQRGGRGRRCPSVGWAWGEVPISGVGVGGTANHQGCHIPAQLRAASRAPTRSLLPGPPAGLLS